MKSTKTDKAGIVQQYAELLNKVEVDISVLQDEKNSKLPHLTNADFAKIIGIEPTTFCDYKSSNKKATPSLLVTLKASLILRMDMRKLVSNWADIEKEFAQIIQ